MSDPTLPPPIDAADRLPNGGHDVSTEAMSRTNALAERMTRPPPTNPDVLTLAVAAAESAAKSVPWLGWVQGLDVEWAYFPDDKYGPAGFTANVRPEMSHMPAWRAAS